MGLYIHYEFVTVDQTLAPDQLNDLRSISTRAEITPSSFTNDYSWSDLGADPADLVAHYFDVGLRWTSAGDRDLLLRLPCQRVARRQLAPYFVGEGLSLRKVGEHLVLGLAFDNEDGHDEHGPFDWGLGPLMPVRAALLAGDMRPAYVAWLFAAEGAGFEDNALDDGVVEPPVPPGLDQPDSGVEALLDFLEVDRDLYAAAAEGSVALEHDGAAITKWVRGLSNKQQQRWLLRAVEQPQLAIGAQMISAYRKQHPSTARPSRSLGELRARANVIREARELEEAKLCRAAELQRKTERESELRRLRQRWAANWTRIEELVDHKHYDAAVDLTMKLREADAGRRNPDFEDRLAELKRSYGRRRGYWQRINQKLRA